MQTRRMAGPRGVLTRVLNPGSRKTLARVLNPGSRKTLARVLNPGSRKILACVLTGALVALGGCSASPSGPATPGHTPTPTPAVTTQPDFPLTAPGNARQIVDFLWAASGHKPILRVEVTATTANITYLDDRNAYTIGFANGAVSKLDSTVTYIDQTEFNPDEFAIDDVGSLFDQAAALSGSRQQQDLQINEYDQGNVIMTVTTTPESSTVFFRPDGTPIHKLDFRNVQDLTEGLSDTVQNSPTVSAVSIKPDALSVDVRIDAATIQRRTRQNALPTIVATLKDSSDSVAFSSTVIDPAVIARLEQDLPGQLNKPAGTTVQVSIQQRSSEDAPRMHFQVGGTEVVTSMDGTILPK
ncbi:hypothetical protein [Propionibacterium sp.]|uniref:hypothetical protein n=1 Tax=Propionibacterium sp. TaxID=1977903 RepID=UPI0039ECE011